MDHRETFALLWPEEQRPKRGPKPRLSLDQIIETAIALADADGLDAVTMQRIAERLGVTKMSLYRYAPGKDELLALALDRALGTPPDLDAEPNWRAALRSWALALHAEMIKHPWALTLAVGIRPFGPNELAWTEAGLRALRPTSLDGAARLDALAMIVWHVRGLVQQSAGQPSANVEAGVADLMTGILTRHADRYPEAAAAFTAAASSGGQDAALTFGLDRILDGLAGYADGVWTGK